MDIPEGNARPDPYSSAASQPAYPWRGRITLSKAPGVAGSPDKTQAAASEVAAFVGTSATSNFSVLGTSVVYSGPDEWSFRRMVLHYATLAKAAGGVDAFVIGSELRGLTTIRSAPSTYPFVSALVTLAADVKAILGATTKVTYAADWSEYFGHYPQDGTGDVNFHLDRFGPRHTLMQSGSTSIGLSQIGATAMPMPIWRPVFARAMISITSRETSAQAKASTGTTHLRPTGQSNPHPNHRRSWQAMGVSLQGHQVVVEQSA